MAEGTIAKFTPKNGAWVPRFLSVFRDTANVRLACHAAGIDRVTAYNRRRTHPGFAKAWAAAEADACDLLEATARKRATDASDTLLIFLLKCHNREKYGDQLTITMIKKIIAEVKNAPDGDLLAFLGYDGSAVRGEAALCAPGGGAAGDPPEE